MSSSWIEGGAAFLWGASPRVEVVILLDGGPTVKAM
jgi:hypothetical protein